MLNRRLATVIVSILLTVSAATAVYGDTPPRVGIDTSDTRPAGKVNEGFALALSTSQPGFRLGEPIDLTLELRNTSSGTLYVAFGASLEIFAVHIVGAASGKALPTLAQAGGSLGGPSTGWGIDPGKSFYFDLRLDRHVHLAHAGRYAVTVSAEKVLNPATHSSVPLESNTIEIAIFDPNAGAASGGYIHAGGRPV